MLRSNRPILVGRTRRHRARKPTLHRASARRRPPSFGNGRWHGGSVPPRRGLFDAREPSKGHQVGAGVDYLCEVLSQLGAAQRAVEARVSVVTGRVDDSPRRPLGLPDHVRRRIRPPPPPAAAERRYGRKASVNPRVGSCTPVDNTGTSLAATPAVRPPRCAQSRTAMNRPMARGEQDPAGPQDPPRLDERRQPLSSAHKVISPRAGGTASTDPSACVSRRTSPISAVTSLCPAAARTCSSGTTSTRCTR